MCNFERCESGADFIREAQKSKHIQKSHWAGDHCTLWGPGGRATLANSRYEYPPYIRRKISRELVAIGLALVAVVVVVLQMI